MIFREIVAFTNAAAERKLKQGDFENPYVFKNYMISKIDSAVGKIIGEHDSPERAAKRTKVMEKKNRSMTTARQDVQKYINFCEAYMRPRTVDMDVERQLLHQAMEEFGR